MKITSKTRSSFRKSVKDSLDALEEGCMNEPSIYAIEKNGEMVFEFSARLEVPKDGFLWLTVQPDSFGDLSGNNEEDAIGIENNCFEEAAFSSLFVSDFNS